MTAAPEQFDPVLALAAERSRRYLASLPIRPVPAASGVSGMLVAFDDHLPDGGDDPVAVLAELADAIEPGLAASGSGRFFGFVVGGSVPASVGADWLVTAWDQNAGLAAVTPGVVAVEHRAGQWVLDLLGLPATAAIGFPTGCCQAHLTCLAAARHHMLAAYGWDVGANGLQGAPTLRVVTGRERHATVDLALRQLGLGTRTARLVDVDGQARIDLGDLERALDEPTDGPTIVILSAGNVNTGSFDPLAEAIDLAHDRGAWVHVDGAFGLWAAASPVHRHLVAGVERADSWASDAHKWLNVPYDCGIAIVSRPEALHAAMGITAAYLIQDGEAVPDPNDLVPEFSRRARGVPVWAMLRSVGRSGVADIVERCCAHAARVGSELDAIDGIAVVNDVVLNQVLVRFSDDDATTRTVAAAVLADGAVYASGSTYLGRAVLRISVCNWRTDDADVDALVAAVRRCHAAVAQVG